MSSLFSSLSVEWWRSWWRERKREKKNGRARQGEKPCTFLSRSFGSRSTYGKKKRVCSLPVYFASVDCEPVWRHLNDVLMKHHCWSCHDMHRMLCNLDKFSQIVLLRNRYAHTTAFSLMPFCLSSTMIHSKLLIVSQHRKSVHLKTEPFSNCSKFIGVIA